MAYTCDELVAFWDCYICGRDSDKEFEIPGKPAVIIVGERKALS